MRKWFFILIASLVAWCCTREAEPELEKEAPGGRVSVTFTINVEEPPTKALGEDYNLNRVNVAVFGGSGYLKEYYPAESLVYNEAKNIYECTISLALTNSKRRVHILGNGPSGIPFGRDYDVLPPIMGEEGETGYWQLVLLDNVTAMTDDQGNLIEPYEASDELKAAFQNIPLIRNWSKIEIMAESNSHFTPYSFAVFNAPKKGTIVPYGGEKGFITNYKDLSYAQLRSDEYAYTGNLPSSKAEFTPFNLTKEDFVNKNKDKGVVEYKEDKDLEPGQIRPAVYLYERPIPDGTIEPTSVIVYGKYFNKNDTSLSPEERASGVECFYKLDLMAGGAYYPILRNFRYTIRIVNIAARGQDTPEEAAAAAGSADVSADVNASHLPDISDGTRRMAIQPWMSYTYLKAKESDTEEPDLFVVFYDDINPKEGGEENLPNMDLSSVTYDLLPDDAGIIKNVTIGKPVGYDDLPDVPQPEDRPENYGWRPISFEIASPTEAHARTQTLRIKCQTATDISSEIPPLYRDIVISLLPVQTMRVRCGDNRILRKKGAEVRIDVDIPDGLVESMFPLYFDIEASNLTLTPDDSQTDYVLPVISGETIIDNSHKHSFYFQRTVTWDEYSALSSHIDLEEETRWRTFSSYFKTNCDDSRTDVYVANRYFITGKTHFDNIESFSNPRYTSSIPYEPDGSVTVEAGMMDDQGPYETVYLELRNLEPADESLTPVSSDPLVKKYAYTPEVKNMTFNLKTTAVGGDVSVTLTTESGIYEPVTLVPWHFSNVGFVEGVIMPSNTNVTTYSQVVWGGVNGAGGNCKVLLGYNTDPDKMHPVVWLRSNGEGGGLTIPNSHTRKEGYDTSTQHKNYSGQENYHWTELDTKSGSYENASLTLSAIGYAEQPVTAGRFKGGLNGFTVSTNATNKNASYPNVSWTDFNTDSKNECDKSVKLNQVTADFSLKVTSDNSEKVPTFADSEPGLKLPAGGHYTWKLLVSSDHGDVFPYFVQFTYYTDDETLYRPRSADPQQDDSNYFVYPGNYSDYVWNLSNWQTGGNLVMNAYSDRDIVITRIIVRGFHGVVYDSENNTGGGDIGFDEGLGNGGQL